MNFVGSKLFKILSATGLKDVPGPLKARQYCGWERGTSGNATEFDSHKGDPPVSGLQVLAALHFIKKSSGPLKGPLEQSGEVL